MPLPFDTFLISYEQVYAQGRTIPGTALFFTRGLDYFEIRAGYMTFVNVEALLSH
jgi:hypothetical protein